MATAEVSIPKADQLQLSQNGDHKNGHLAAAAINGAAGRRSGSSPDTYHSCSTSSGPSEFDISSGEYDRLQGQLDLSMGSENEHVAGIFGRPDVEEEEKDKQVNQ